MRAGAIRYVVDDGRASWGNPLCGGCIQPVVYLSGRRDSADSMRGERRSRSGRCGSSRRTPVP